MPDKKRSILDVAREHKARGGGQPKQPQPFVAYEDLVAGCGHPVKFGLFADKHDRFRDARREKQRRGACPACKARRREEEERAAAARREARGRGAAEWEARRAKLTRLPEGSRFSVEYDARQQKWFGQMAVCAGDRGVPYLFAGSASGVFKLLSRLDQQWRDFCGQHGLDPSTGKSQENTGSGGSV